MYEIANILILCPCVYVCIGVITLVHVCIGVIMLVHMGMCVLVSSESKQALSINHSGVQDEGWTTLSLYRFNISVDKYAHFILDNYGVYIKLVQIFRLYFLFLCIRIFFSLFLFMSRVYA